MLVNEFGGRPDAALLATDVDGVAIGEVAGGCLCCVNGVPFQVGSVACCVGARLDRLFIEPPGWGLAGAVETAAGSSLVRRPGPALVVVLMPPLASGQPLEAQEQRWKQPACCC